LWGKDSTFALRRLLDNPNDPANIKLAGVRDFSSCLSRTVKFWTEMCYSQAESSATQLATIKVMTERVL
jgi:hypothetical protein